MAYLLWFAVAASLGLVAVTVRALLEVFDE